MDFNCTAALIQGFCFPAVNTTVQNDSKLVESVDVKPRIWRRRAYGGPTISYIQIFDCKEGQHPNSCIFQRPTIVIFEL